MTPELREYFGVEGERGVLVVRVEDDSPAEKAEIEVGDVVVEVNGTSVRRPRDLARAVQQSSPGATVEIDLIRRGEERQVRATLPDREEWSLRGPMPPGLVPELFPPGIEPELFSTELERTLRLLQEQLREIEERLEDLEEWIGPPSPAPDRT
jgi:membrane-associated protease RseP (regulator of RpoE activity)